MVILPLAFAFFSFLLLVILGSGWISHRGRVAALEVIGEAVGKGQQLDMALVERLMAPTRPAPVGKWYAIVCFFFAVAGTALGFALGTSVIMFGEGLALGAAGRAGMMVGAYINGCVGAGFMTLGVMSLHYFSGRARPAPKWDYGTVLGLMCLFIGTGGLAIGVGLTLGGLGYGEVDPSGATLAGMMVGAMVNLFTGLGLTLLGVFIFRLFGEPQDTRDKARREKSDA